MQGDNEERSIPAKPESGQFHRSGIVRICVLLQLIIFVVGDHEYSGFFTNKKYCEQARSQANVMHLTLKCDAFESNWDRRAAN